jgi:hypothetical protein
MQSDEKLKEAQYFLGKLTADLDFEELAFNLSAFVSAWRSVYDVLLYDYAERYFDVDREDRIHVTRESFKIVARATKNRGAERFIEWYNHYQTVLQKNDLWSLRNFLLHKGNLVREIYVPVDMGTSSIAANVPPNSGVVILRDGKLWLGAKTFGDFFVGQMLEKCNNGFALMKQIVEEAKEKFE